jgi:hypothetical protein
MRRFGLVRFKSLRKLLQNNPLIHTQSLIVAGFVALPKRKKWKK